MYTNKNKLIDFGDCIYVIYYPNDDKNDTKFGINYSKKQMQGSKLKQQLITGEGHIIDPPK